MCFPSVTFEYLAGQLLSESPANFSFWWLDTFYIFDREVLLYSFSEPATDRSWKEKLRRKFPQKGRSWWEFFLVKLQAALPLSYTAKYTSLNFKNFKFKDNQFLYTNYAWYYKIKVLFWRSEIKYQMTLLITD